MKQRGVLGSLACPTGQPLGFRAAKFGAICPSGALNSQVSMKFRWLSFILSLCLSGCREKGTSHSEKAVGDLPSAAIEQGSELRVQDKTEPTSAVKITPEQIGSTLRVRVAFGGLPPRDYAGALLHRDEIANKSAVQGKDRFVLTLLKGWKESLLRNPNGRIIVYRNKVGSQGETVANPFPARLLQFEEKTGWAVLTYLDEFEYSADVGFHLDRTAPAASVGILRILSETSPNPAADSDASAPQLPPNLPPQGNGSGSGLGKQRPAGPPFSVDAGSYLAGTEGHGAIRLPPIKASATPAAVHLAIRPPDKLAGLVEEEPAGQGTMTPIGGLLLEIKPVSVTPVSLVFDMNTGGGVQFHLAAQTTPPDLPLHLGMLVKEGADIVLAEVAKPDADGTFPPIAKQGLQSLYPDSKTPGQWVGTLSVPANLGNERTYLVQLSWPLFPESKTASIYGKPFLVKLRRTAQGIYPTVEGLSAQTAESVVARLPVASYAMTAPVRSVHLIAGGREALMEFETAPYWKRFSFEKKDWLPLPSGDYSNVYCTGNLDSILLLDRAASEVRKYGLPDLRLITSAKLPPSDYVALLAGCNSSHAPVHVIARSGTQALDPETLLRRDIPPIQAAGSAGPTYTRTDLYNVSGDGMSVQVIGHSRFTHNYNDDVSGLRFSRLLDLKSESEVNALGVSATYIADQWLRWRAMLHDGSLPAEKPASIPSDPRTNLAENCPVIFCLQGANGMTVPPKSAQLLCFSFFDRSPFAVVDLPEWSYRSGSGPPNGEHWAFLDPYSLRLGTLSEDRKTWFVRDLPDLPVRDQPILLTDRSLV